ncbi:hypothetical protein C8R31_10643 [Nitrosospira sp. Nsp2]|uniref:hypothetical protein n=1 Tax=Nitrosospira sp. Nsp2 TaxID=136548 RepID=UPI000D4DB9DB|nr:hypothetical protein [Nitrosospira sp. Nsp2]PTR14371.1 hypothetical protein C8R31_10643 [Nitrosospira sp. Nsp2]
MGKRKPVLYRLMRFTPFAELPRRKKRDRYVSLRWKIVRDTGTYGGKFTSRLMLDEPGRPQLYMQWFKVYFLGTDGVTIWNALIHTATFEFWSRTSELASDRALSLLSREQQNQEGRPEFEGPFMRDGKMYYTLAKRTPQTYDCFGGLTLREYQKKTELEITENEPPPIYESFKLDPLYEYGIGLHAVVEAEEINREVIERTIDRFLEVGETDWQSTHPVPREALPVVSLEAALAKVEYPGVLLGLAERS